ncbi:Hypothetical protein SCLAV_2877 [Streptomyces clavuligerus]|uniref:Uncharacterized protein n=1 Tax=Streptomyces clavuligerus TaxID=1901 RepID=E2PVN6_STRCL|nr:Hypothetical protein SCLAV_2877 [Streptomyces clavuligerus]
MSAPMLWRTPRNLCMERGTVLWTKSCHAREDPSDQRVFHPRPVGEKNFSPGAKIATNETPRNRRFDEK